MFESSLSLDGDIQYCALEIGVVSGATSVVTSIVTSTSVFGCNRGNSSWKMTGNSSTLVFEDKSFNYDFESFRKSTKASHHSWADGSWQGTDTPSCVPSRHYLNIR